jgi:molybdopterin molybdotransferase
MPEFLSLFTPHEAISTMFQKLMRLDQIEIVSTSQSIGRILAEDLRSPSPLPSFNRSTVDGYAVQSVDTFGALDSMPTYLKVVGEVEMGSGHELEIGSGQSILIHTGGMIPLNSDAVVMVEDTQRIENREVEIRKAVAPGENMLSIGEDVKEGELIMSTGREIRSVDIGGLMALGTMNIQVWKKPRIGIISSGDEIIQPDQVLKMSQVRDINSQMLSTLVSRWGGTPIPYGISPDNFDDLLAIAKKAFKECDSVIITAGSSVSIRDLTADVINSLGKPGVLVHGVNIRPGKPTILAVCSGKAVIGLPGNPVSAFVTANLFVSPLIKFLLNGKQKELQVTIRSRLSSNIPSQTGREDWVPVRLEKELKGWLAIPIFSRSNFIFSLISADGLICIQPECTGLEVDELVDVFLLQ